MDIPVIERVKIQAQVLVPLIKALQAELGEEKANALVRGSIGNLYRDYGEKWWRGQDTSNLGDNMAAEFKRFSAAGALDYDVIKKTADSFEINVTGCRYAEFYKKLGVPELGF